ncbi:hypothetical protein BX285_4159 [Streptomyces sp. 1114.5]|uniref:hypothetical protein n=1 Tax=unclassified Streptomyces TaxID=2593676 RepID=UPI000BC8CCD3|nr:MULTISPECIES: hypothetical protein [unclassified Streptomyces]RKT19690.1 hypothetical protein BX285_4159 [Streptomyces sp. 1114.5]SOB85889.1 hypothetical protein SAMN06272789_6190 [Streptomyces sp. 1331.2]
MNDERPNIQYGDRVTIHGGSGNIGVQHNTGPGAGQALPPEVVALFARLAAVVTELARDGRLQEADRQSLADSLPVLTSPATEEPRRRRNTLLLLAGVAQSLGEAAAPALGLANQLLALLSG